MSVTEADGPDAAAATPAAGAALDPARLGDLLGGPDTAWLVERIRGRLERGEPVDGTVTLVGATAGQRRAAARLLDRGVGRGTELSVPLPEAAAALARAGAAPSLHAAVAALTGPVRDLAAERAGELQRWEDVLEPARASPLVSLAWYADWLEEITRDGTVTRLIRQGHGAAVGQAARVLEQAPAEHEPGGIALADLASSAAGGPAALDGGPLPALVLRALAGREQVPPPADAAAARSLWTMTGVVVTNDLASQVLVLNLRAAGEPLGRWLSEAAAAGQPFRVTLRQLTAMTVTPYGPAVYVCGTPAVVRAAAAGLGAACPPLVCTEGEPSVACTRLLHAAAAAGAAVYWHGDLSWPGVRAAGAAVRRLGAAPWLMSAADYQAGLSAGSTEPLTGRPGPVPWDPRLGELMQAAGRAVTEDGMLPELLAGLVAGAGAA